MLGQEYYKGNRPRDTIEREICTFLENDLRMPDYCIRRDECSSKQYWGGWLIKDVSELYIYAYIIGLILIFSERQRNETQQGSSVTTLLHCPMSFRAECPNQMKVVEKSKVIFVYRNPVMTTIARRF